MVFHLQGAGRRPWGQLLAKAVLGKQQQLQGWLPVLGRTWNVAWWHGRGYNGDVVCPQRSRCNIYSIFNDLRLFAPNSWADAGRWGEDIRQAWGAIGQGHHHFRSMVHALSVRTALLKYLALLELCWWCLCLLSPRRLSCDFGGFVHSRLYRKSSACDSIAGNLSLTHCSCGEQCAVVAEEFFTFTVDSWNSLK